MNTREQAVLEQAIDEIRALRREREVLLAKVEVMELFACVLYTKPAMKDQGYSEDVVFALNKIIEELGETQ